MSFRLVATLTALLFLYLFAVQLIAPGLQMSNLGVAPDAGGAVMGRRAAPAFLAVAVILWLFREEGPGIARARLSLAVVAMMVLIVLVGLYELLTGAAGTRIIGAMAVEALVALAFFRFARGD